MGEVLFVRVSAAGRCVNARLDPTSRVTPPPGGFYAFFVVQMKDTHKKLFLLVIGNKSKKPRRKGRVVFGGGGLLVGHVSFIFLRLFMVGDQCRKRGEGVAHPHVKPHRLRGIQPP